MTARSVIRLPSIVLRVKKQKVFQRVGFWPCIALSLFSPNEYLIQAVDHEDVLAFAAKIMRKQFQSLHKPWQVCTRLLLASQRSLQ